MVDDEDARELERETKKHYRTTQELGTEIEELEERSDDIHTMVVERNSYINQISNAISDTITYLKGNRKELESDKEAVENSNEKLEEVQEELSRRNFGKLAGYGLAALGTGAALTGGAFAYDEVTGDPQALNPEDYDTYIDSEETLEDLAMSYQNSDTESLNSIGDRLEQEIDQNSEINLGFKSGFADDFVDVNAGRDLVKRYELGQAAYEQAVDETLDVTQQ
jgi:hypothetical protein